jgi:hypothetical protein
MKLERQRYEFLTVNTPVMPAFRNTLNTNQIGTEQVRMPELVPVYKWFVLILPVSL